VPAMAIILLAKDPSVESVGDSIASPTTDGSRPPEGVHDAELRGFVLGRCWHSHCD
jgi:hypothetical protein